MKKVKMQPDAPKGAETAQIQEKTVSMALDNPEPQKNVHKRVIRVQFDIEYFGTNGKEMDDLSQTMPDMNLTVRQLLQNHSRGINDQTEIRQPLYFETEIPTMTDITDVTRYKESLQERLAQTEAWIKAEQEEAEQKRQEELAKTSPFKE